MIGMVCWLFAGLILHYEKRWESEEDRKNWEKWEECEKMREEMGHEVGIVKIRKTTRPARKKHRH